MEQLNEIVTYSVPGRHRAVRWLAGVLAALLVVGCGSWPVRQALAGEIPVTNEAASTAGAHSYFMDIIREVYGSDQKPSPDRHEPSPAFFQCVEPIGQTVEEDGIRVTVLEALSDGRYLAVYMEVENLVPRDWAMVDVAISVQARGKAALPMYTSTAAMWVPYTLHLDDEMWTRPCPWFGIFELPEGADGQVSVTVEVGIFRLNGPLVMLAPILYEQGENANDPWLDLFRARMEACGVIVAGENELDAAAWARDGYVPITGSKFALDEGDELSSGAAEARGEIRRTGTVNMAFTVRGNAGASAARELAPGGEYALGDDRIWVDSVFVSPVLVSLGMKSTFSGADTNMSPGTLLADGAGNLIEWESVIRFVSTSSAFMWEEGGTEDLNGFHVWAAPGSYLPAEQLIIAIMKPEQRYGGLETVADLSQKGIEYVVIPLDGAGWTAAGFPLPEEVPESLDAVIPAEGSLERYIPVPLPTRVP